MIRHILKLFHILTIKQVIKSISGYRLCHQGLASQEVTTDNIAKWEEHEFPAILSTD